MATPNGMGIYENGKEKYSPPVQAENDVEYAELSMAHDMPLQPPSGRVTSAPRPWETNADPVDEHVMLLHLFELQDRDRQALQGAWGKLFKSSTSSKPESKRTKTFIDSLDFNLSPVGSSRTTTEAPNPLDLPSTSSASALRSSSSSAHPKVIPGSSRKVLSGKYRPRDLPNRSSGQDPTNKWTEQVIPLPTNPQGDICPLEILFQSLNFEEPQGLDQVLKLPAVGPLRSPSPPRQVPVPVSEPSRDGSSAFSWTPSLLSNRKLPKTKDEAGNSASELLRKKNTRSPDRPKSS